MKKKVLFTATVDSHIELFHLPYLKYFKENGYEVHVATNGDNEIPYCDKKIKIPFDRSPFKISNLKAIKQLKKVIMEEKYDIIHTHTPMGSVVTRLAAKKARKKYHTRVIYTAHGFHFYKGAPKLYWMLFYPVEKHLSKYTDTLILINQEDYNLAKTKFKKCKDIQYVPGVGIDESKFDIKMTSKEKTELRKSLGLNNDDFVMIYPAELSKRKNQEFLIDSLNKLIKENNNIHILLPGSDSLNNYLQTQVRNLNLENNIHFLGFRKDIPQLLRISDLAISTSKQEGLPVNIMEAMYVGLPIVATDCRGNRDLIENEVNGYIINQNDSIDFYNKIELIYRDKKIRDLLSKGSQEKIKEYLLDEILEEMKKIYGVLSLDLISIIVPVYNVEVFLQRCVDSILNQNYKLLEVILVDDGSTDNSPKICDEYAKKDNRIRVIHKKNGGLSDARNAGINVVKGKYITFIDSDDFIACDYIEVLYKLLKSTKSDISIGVWQEIYDDGSKKSIYNVKKEKIVVDNNINMLKRMMYQKDFDTSACAKLYKRELFDNIRYPINKLYEDLATTYKVFFEAKKISYTNREIYFYYKRKDSITNSTFKKKDMDLIEISNNMLNDIIIYTEKNKLDKSLINSAISRFISSNFSILLKTNMNEKFNSYNNVCINNIKKYAKFNIKARFKNNLAILLFKINPQLIKRIRRK